MDGGVANSLVLADAGELAALQSLREVNQRLAVRLEFVVRDALLVLRKQLLELARVLQVEVGLKPQLEALVALGYF